MTTIDLYNNELPHEENAIETAGFYNEATEDYKFWSRDFNMHFGYYSFLRTNPFRRDSMLNEMNRQYTTAWAMPRICATWAAVWVAPCGTG